MIQVQHVPRDFSFILTCDVCGSPISDHQQGIAVFPIMLQKQKNPTILDVYHVHRGACDKAVANRIRVAGFLDANENLDVHLGGLLESLQIKSDALERAMISAAERDS